MLYILHMVKYDIIDMCHIINIVNMVNESGLMFSLLEYESHVKINTYPVAITISISITSIICEKPCFFALCGHTVLKKSEANIKNKGSQTMKLRAWTKNKTLTGKQNSHCL